MLALSRCVGKAQSWDACLWPVAVLFSVVAFLAVAPVLLRLLVSVIPPEIQTRFGIADGPRVRDWLSVDTVLLVFALAAALRMLVRARKRVIVEQFVDYTDRDGKAVRGAATLLVTELARLGDLFRLANTSPPAVGFERRGGFQAGKDAASFLPANADGLTEALEGAVASDAKLEVGAVKVPIGVVLSLLNRAVRGPCVVASVHFTKAGVGPTLSAQLVRGRRAAAIWRVDPPSEAHDARTASAYLDTMIHELAVRMFTTLSFEGSERWRAVWAFASYLRLYRDLSGTPEEQMRQLKCAEGELHKAIAADKRFGIAHYNLGVVYTNLAQETERAAEQASQELTGPCPEKLHAVSAMRREAASVAPAASGEHTSHIGGARRPYVDCLDRPRREKARVAFWTATQTTPDDWQPHYALAVTQFSEMAQSEPIDIDTFLTADDDSRRIRLERVIRSCDQALALRPDGRSSKAIVHDLRGMAAIRLVRPGLPDGRARFRAGIHDHQIAVVDSWRELRRAERIARANSTAATGRLEKERNNATACLHNLALAYGRRALLAVKESRDDCPKSAAKRHRSRVRVRCDFAAADRAFRAAVDVAGAKTERAIASHYERGTLLERRGDSALAAGKHAQAAVFYGSAADAYRRAAEIKPTHAEYAAREAYSLAKKAYANPATRADARRIYERAATAMLELAPDFAHSVAPLRTRILQRRCENTLDAVARTYAVLDDDVAVERVKELRMLWRRMQRASSLAAARERCGLDAANERQVTQEIKQLQAKRHRYATRRAHASRSKTFPTPDWRWECDQIAMCLVRLFAAEDDWANAQMLLDQLIDEMGQRGLPDSERVTDYHLEDERSRALRHARRRTRVVRAEPAASSTPQMEQNGTDVVLRRTPRSSVAGPPPQHARAISSRGQLARLGDVIVEMSAGWSACCKADGGAHSISRFLRSHHCARAMPVIRWGRPTRPTVGSAN